MRYLYLIPARSGSKRLPDKNITLLAGKPLLYYSLELARTLADDRDILVSTDDQAILALCNKIGYNTSYVRASSLATDEAGMDNVIRDGIEHMSKVNSTHYDAVVLLQPTSPLRTADDIKRCTHLFESHQELDMVTTTCVSRTSPFKNLFYQVDGVLKRFLEKSSSAVSADQLVRLNGAVYVINVDSIKQGNIPDFKNIRSHLMPAERSVDIDEEIDWILTEALLNRKNH